MKFRYLRRGNPGVLSLAILLGYLESGSVDAVMNKGIHRCCPTAFMRAISDTQQEISEMATRISQRCETTHDDSNYQSDDGRDRQTLSRTTSRRSSKDSNLRTPPSVRTVKQASPSAPRSFADWPM